MLDSQAVRVGFVTQLLWPRYGGFWRDLVEGAEAESVFPTEEGVRAALTDDDVQQVPAAAFRLAAAQAKSLAEDVDLLVVPRLNRETEVARGGGQDPWIADFPGALRSALHGLPPLRSVPSDLGASVESEAVDLLQALLHDPPAVRRVWARLRTQAKPPRLRPVTWNYRPGELATVALVGQPWLLNDAVAKVVASETEHVVSQHRLDPLELRAEGHRSDPQLIDTDAEVLGAARLAARRASVSRLRLLVDEGSGSDAWLARRLERASHKAVEVVTVQDALADVDPVDTLSNLQLD